MRTDERDAQAGQESKGFSLLTHIAIVLAVLLLFLVLMFFYVIQPLGYDRERPNITKCKNNLKQLGLCLNSYFSDGTSTAMPILKSFEVSATNDGGFGFDANMTSCYATRLDGLSHYVWNPKLSGGKWPDWNNSNSPLIWDAAQHRRDNKVNVLFGDGHVEEMTPERLKELTR